MRKKFKDYESYEWGDLLVPTGDGFNSGLFRDNDYVIFLRESNGLLTCLRKGTVTPTRYSPDFLRYSRTVLP